MATPGSLTMTMTRCSRGRGGTRVIVRNPAKFLRNRNRTVTNTCACACGKRVHKDRQVRTLASSSSSSSSSSSENVPETKSAAGKGFAPQTPNPGQQILDVTDVARDDQGNPTSIKLAAPEGTKALTREQMDAAADAIMGGNKVWMRSRAKAKKEVPAADQLADFLATREGHLSLLGAATKVEEVPCDDKNARRYVLVAPEMKFPGLTLRPRSTMEIKNNGKKVTLRQVESVIEGEPEKMVTALQMMTSDQTLENDISVSNNRDGSATVTAKLRLEIGMLLPKKFPVPRRLIEGLGSKLFSSALEKQATVFLNKVVRAYGSTTDEDENDATDIGMFDTSPRDQ